MSPATLGSLQGLHHVDPDLQTIEVWAGTKLKALGELLYQQGFSQEIWVHCPSKIHA
ncbi:hypothetical protein [Brevibacillus sp. NRS-1366]|uniref:hypothetical protein n=1 Tax=Brevibacillus sp. NRS-1366 TaxID=3233899 RepID=UPI003D1B82B0